MWKTSTFGFTTSKLCWLASQLTLASLLSVLFYFHPDGLLSACERCLLISNIQPEYIQPVMERVTLSIKSVASCREKPNLLLLFMPFSGLIRNVTSLIAHVGLLWFFSPLPRLNAFKWELIILTWTNFVAHHWLYYLCITLGVTWFLVFQIIFKFLKKNKTVGWSLANNILILFVWLIKGCSNHICLYMLYNH